MVHHDFTCVIQVRATNEEKCKAARILHEVFPHWKVIRPREEAIKQYAQGSFQAMSPDVPYKEEKPQHTYYCLFLPLGIYCGFGAENIHHAYNKAAKYWGARNQVGRPYDDMPESKIQRDCRIYVFDDIRHVSLTRKEVSHTLMTKLVKAWREENS